MQADEPLRWGILGASQIAREAMIPAMKSSGLNRLVAVASRDLNRAQLLARSAEGIRTYDSYPALLEDEAVEAIYVSLPNSLHSQWATKALRADKHVLCEKPMAMTKEEASRMATAARRAQKILMEGLMYRFQPRVDRVASILESGVIGKLQLVRAIYTFPLAKPHDIRLDRTLGGGALWDVGSYCVDSIRVFAQKEPLCVWARSRRIIETGVDMRSAGLLDFDGGVIGEFYCAMDRKEVGLIEIYGENGHIIMPDAFRLWSGMDQVILHIQAEDSWVEEFSYVDQYLNEVDAFAKAVRLNRSAPLPVEGSINNTATLEALERSSFDGPVSLHL